MAHTFMTENHDEEEYKVKWDNYNLTSLLSNSSILPDVTLVTEDGIERESHRIILAAISPFLKDLMLSTKEDDVLIYLDGICHKYLDLVLTVLNTGIVYPNNSDETLEFMNTCLALGINNINIFNDEISSGEKISNDFENIGENQTKFVTENTMDCNEEKSLKKLKCVHCDKNFRLRSNLNHHIKGVHEKVRYPCNLCKKQFYDQRNLNKHSCSDSTKKGQNKSKSKKPNKNHNILHNMKRKYECSLCDKSFMLKGNFYNHMNGVHKKVKYSCKLCHGQFSHRSNLRKHVLSVHENVKYFCDFCDKVCSDQSNLRSHKRFMHGNCGCGQTFPDKKEFKRHRDACIIRSRFVFQKN